MAFSRQFRSSQREGDDACCLREDEPTVRTEAEQEHGSMRIERTGRHPERV
jgi:hypothetical protein